MGCSSQSAGYFGDTVATFRDLFYRFNLEFFGITLVAYKHFVYGHFL